MSAQRQQDVRIAAQEDAWDAGHSYMAPEPVPEFEKSVADEPPLRGYLLDEWTEK